MNVHITDLSTAEMYIPAYISTPKAPQKQSACLESFDRKNVLTLSHILATQRALFHYPFSRYLQTYFRTETLHSSAGAHKSIKLLLVFTILTRVYRFSTL